MSDTLLPQLCTMGAEMDEARGPTVHWKKLGTSSYIVPTVTDRHPAFETVYFLNKIVVAHQFADSTGGCVRSDCYGVEYQSLTATQRVKVKCLVPSYVATMPKRILESFAVRSPGSS